MTLGEKIRCARKYCGLSQGQLAERLCVSRSAIAKWETDKGMPDVENLKMLARLLHVSVDSLLDDSTDADSPLIRERINLAAYGRGCSKIRKDRMMLDKFQDARICTLLGRPELTEGETVVDKTLGFLTPVPFGRPEYLKSVRDLEKDFYLVEQEYDQFFVTVSDMFLEVRPFSQTQCQDTFRLGSWTFIRGSYLMKE